MIARSTPSDLKVLISLPSWPSDIQCTVFACCSISGNASSLMAATTISIPWLRAACSTRKGNLPFPAMRPYLLDDSTFGFPNEVQNDLNFRRIEPGLDRFDCLRGIQLRLEQQPKCCPDILNLLRRETLSFQTEHVGPIRLRVALADCFRIRQNILGNDTVAADVAVRSDPAELMNAGKRAYCRMVFDGDMAGQSRCVRHDDVV